MDIEIINMAVAEKRLYAKDTNRGEVYCTVQFGEKRLNVGLGRYMCLKGSQVGVVFEQSPGQPIYKIYGKVGKITLALQDRQTTTSGSPLVGDFIALDWGGSLPSDFNKGGLAISWYCSQVIEAKGDEYKMSYDDGARWYEFKAFGASDPSDDGLYNIYPALPPDWELDLTAESDD